MNVINILGSPRKNGTSARIAQAFTDEAETNGADVTNYYLNGMDFRGCQGCEGCHTKSDKCVLKDDLTAALNEMREADVLVMSTPVYYGGTSGQFKLFIDRTWSHVEVDYSNPNPFSSRLPKGKTALFIVSQGDKESAHMDIVERYTEIFELYGYDLTIIRATGLATGAVDADVSEEQVQAQNLARELTAN